MVVDSAIHQRVDVVDEEGTVPERFGRSVQKLATIFYVDDGLLASP